MAFGCQPLFDPGETSLIVVDMQRGQDFRFRWIFKVPADSVVEISRRNRETNTSPSLHATVRNHRQRSGRAFVYDSREAFTLSCSERALAGPAECCPARRRGRRGAVRS